MYRVEEIEKVLHTQPSFSVVQIHGKEGKRRRKFPGDGNSAADTLVETAAAHEIEHSDQEYALVVIIRINPIGQEHAGSNWKNGQNQVLRAASGNPDNTGHNEKTDQQCKVYVLLPRIKPVSF